MKTVVSQDSTLIDVLSLLDPACSKNTLRSWLEKGRVQVNGKIVKQGKFLVSKGQEVVVGKRTHFIHQDIEVLYEDRDLVVIVKPEGLLSVDTDFEHETSAHRILKRKKASGIVYPVHRLDRETSGVMLFCYTEAARDGMKKQFEKHTIDREYRAIVEGKVESAKGTWESLLVEDDNYYVRSINNAVKGKRAITHYEVVAQNERYSALRLTLETGRKNQIRVHCQNAKHSVVGDAKYGAKGNPVKRLCLHAHRLGFTHPITEKKLSFSAPIPEIFHKLVLPHVPLSLHAGL